MNDPVITPLGDTAVTIRLGDIIELEVNEEVVRLASRVREAAIPGVTDVVSAYASFSVHYDPVTIGYHDIVSRIEAAMKVLPAEPAEITAGRLTIIKVRYDGEDLAEVAQRTALTVEEVIRIHSSAVYRVFVVGFVPGWAYLGPLDERLRLPRRESPRQRVPAGSVAIAEAQTGVYPSATPGGWHLIGTTQLTTFDPARDPPSAFRVGDMVQFEPVQ